MEIAPPRPWPQWGWSDVAMVVSLYITVMLLVFLVGPSLVAGAPFFQGLKSAEIIRQPLYFVPAQLLTYVISFFFIRMFITLKADEDFWIAVQWRLPDAAGIFANLVSGVALALVIVVVQAIIPMPKAVPMDQYFKDSVSATLMGVFAVCVAPLAEETFFRGLLLPVAMKNVNKAIAVIFVSLAFAALHAAQLGRHIAPIAILFIVGLAFTIRRLRAQSLAASWLMHAGYNATLFGIMWWATDGFRHLDKLR